MLNLILTLFITNLAIVCGAVIHFWRTQHEPERRTPRPNPWCATRKEPKP